MKTIRLKTCDDVSQAPLAKHKNALLDVHHETSLPIPPSLCGQPRAGTHWTGCLAPHPASQHFYLVCEQSEGLDRRALHQLKSTSYCEVYLLDGGLDGWRSVGGEIFIDVNAPSKALY